MVVAAVQLLMVLSPISHFLKANRIDDKFIHAHTPRSVKKAIHRVVFGQAWL
jgi:hypothetical protein